MPINQHNINTLQNIVRNAIFAALLLTALIEITARSPVAWVTMIEETGGGSYWLGLRSSVATP
jgi:hypothetical protein